MRKLFIILIFLPLIGYSQVNNSDNLLWKFYVSTSYSAIKSKGVTNKQTGIYGVKPLSFVSSAGFLTGGIIFTKHIALEGSIGLVLLPVKYTLIYPTKEEDTLVGIEWANEDSYFKTKQYVTGLCIMLGPDFYFNAGKKITFHVGTGINSSIYDGNTAGINMSTSTEDYLLSYTVFKSDVVANQYKISSLYIKTGIEYLISRKISIKANASYIYSNKIIFTNYYSVLPDFEHLNSIGTYKQFSRFPEFSLGFTFYLQ